MPNIREMSIEVKIPSYFQRYTNGVDIAEVNGTTVGECLHDLVKQFPDIKSMLFYEPDGLDECIAICVNREVLTAWDEPMRRGVVDGDEISLLVMAAGG